MASAQIIIPCFNEEHRLNVAAFRQFRAQLHDVRFLFVNDGSKDTTGHLLADLKCSDENRFSVLDLKKNRGKGEAIRQGVLATANSRLDYFGFWDADLATPLDAIPMFIDLAESRPAIQMVIGARVKLLGRTIERRAIRHYIGRIFATVVSTILELDVYDTQCGAKLFRSSSAMYALFREPFSSRWIFDVEILARLIKHRRGTDLPQAKDMIYEFPLVEWRDIPGSKLTWHDFIRATCDLARVYGRYLGR